MIIEGSHKVLGKGIYVSDIQNDSLAQNVAIPAKIRYEAKVHPKVVPFNLQAGLRVGDMILAVNTESFLTVNYDEVMAKLNFVANIPSGNMILKFLF